MVITLFLELYLGEIWGAFSISVVVFFLRTRRKKKNLSFCAKYQASFELQKDFSINHQRSRGIMAVKPTVALRAMLVGGLAAFAKIAGAMKAAGGVKVGAAAAAMTAAATAAVAGPKKDQPDASKQPTK